MHWPVLFGFILFPYIAWGAAADLFLQLGKLSPAERQQTLIESAKKEGELMLYSSSALEEIQALEKYPFLQTRFNRKGGSQLFTVRN